MRFIFYSPIHFEKWDWRNSVEKGIGGSETSHVEMAWRLAARGHEVISYIPLPDDMPSGSEWRGAKWFRIEDADFSMPGWWMLYRCPDVLDKFDLIRPDQILNLMMQDWDYPNWTPGRILKLNRIVPLCNAHANWLVKRHPEFVNKIWITRNGIKDDLIREVESGEQIVRDKYRIMYASSPDRGLLSALKIFKRAKEFVPQLTLYITYGFNNIDKLIEKGNKQFAKDKEECLKLIEETGAVMLGRVSQDELYKEWFKTGIWLYCTSFWETGPIHGSSLIETLYGSIKIKDLVGLNNFYVYSCNKDGELSVSLVKNVVLKRKDENVIRIKYKPGIGRNALEEKELILTPDHEVMMINGTYKEARYIQAGDRLKAFHKQPNGWGKGYAKIGLTETELVPEHRFVASFFAKRDLYRDEVVDHLDGNTRNNNPLNLFIRDNQSEHASDHWHRLSEEEKLKRTAENRQGVLQYLSTLTKEELEKRSQNSLEFWDKIKNLPESERKEWFKYRASCVTEVGKEGRRKATQERMDARFGNSSWRDSELLHDLYVNQELSTVEIAKQLGCSSTTIGLWLEKFGIQKRDLSQAQLAKGKLCSNHVVTNIENFGIADVYCMEVEPDHNFIANNIVVHNCITGLESQAMGAIPIFSPIWAQGENTKWGFPIEGSPDSPMTIAKFAGTIVQLVNTPDFESMRQPMMEEVRSKWSWDVFAGQWEEQAKKDLEKEPVKSILLAKVNHKISIVTPSIRPEGLKMVWECLRKQTYRDFEWLIGCPQPNDFCGDYRGDTRTRVIQEPEYKDGDMYVLNKTWNKLFQAARGDFLVSIVDWIWFENDALERLVEHWKTDKKLCVSGCGDQYTEIINNKPENKCWNDPRQLGPCDPVQMEFVIASVPKEAMMNEEYDKVAALSEKELCCRLAKQGYRFLIDKDIEYRSYKHEKHWTDWDARYAEGLKMFRKDVQ